jgi:hypothetical protein
MVDREDTVGVSLPTSVRVLMPNGHVEAMKLETYLAGVVATEIGAGAPLEALKAQAVAARTYAAAAHRHPDHEADVCTTTHCQKWKRVDPVVAPEVFRALSETWGMVALYDGKLIDAFFFEHCDGHTRNSEEMLMPEVKYLRGVDCSCGFLTLKGHGVGMCKRGAIVMARRGASFEQILRHYYRGVVVIHTARENHVAEREEPALEAEPPVPAPKPRVRVRVRKPTPPAAPAPADVELERPARHRPARPSIRRAPAREETPPEAPEPKQERVAVKPAEEKADDAAIVVKPVQRPSAPRPAVSPQKEKLRDVIVGEVVSKSEAAAPTQPTKPPRRVHIDHLPGARIIAGCLAEVGVAILIEDPQGNKIVTQSGSAPYYGEGGFETSVDGDGRYLVTLDDQIVEVQVDGETVFIHAT